MHNIKGDGQPTLAAMVFHLLWILRFPLAYARLALEKDSLSKAVTERHRSTLAVSRGSVTAKIAACLQAF